MSTDTSVNFQVNLGNGALVKAQGRGTISIKMQAQEKRQKLDETSVKCVLVGYSNISKGYRLYNLKTRSVITSRDVTFNENASWNWESNEVEKNESVVDETRQVPTMENEGDDDGDAEFSIPNGSSSSLDPSSSHPQLARRIRNLEDVYARCNFCSIEPKTFEEAMKQEAWKNTIYAIRNLCDRKE